MPTLAAAVIKESGIKELKMQDIGLRPGGEKMHESLLSQEEINRTETHKLCGHLIVLPTHRSWSALPYQLHGKKIAGAHCSEHAPRYTVEELLVMLKDVPRRPANE